MGLKTSEETESLSTAQCSKCLAAFYCSNKHQKQDWPTQDTRQQYKMRQMACGMADRFSKIHVSYSCYNQ